MSTPYSFLRLLSGNTGTGGDFINAQLTAIADEVDGKESLSNKNQPNGYAGLDINGVVVGPVQLRQGTRSALDSISLLDGETYYCTDTGEMYQGVDSVNTFIGGRATSYYVTSSDTTLTPSVYSKIFQQTGGTNKVTLTAEPGAIYRARGFAVLSIASESDYNKVAIGFLQNDGFAYSFTAIDYSIFGNATYISTTGNFSVGVNESVGSYVVSAFSTPGADVATQIVTFDFTLKSIVSGRNLPLELQLATADQLIGNITTSKFFVTVERIK